MIIYRRNRSTSTLQRSYQLKALHNKTFDFCDFWGLAAAHCLSCYRQPFEAILMLCDVTLFRPFHFRNKLALTYVLALTERGAEKASGDKYTHFTCHRSLSPLKSLQIASFYLLRGKRLSSSTFVSQIIMHIASESVSSSYTVTRLFSIFNEQLLNNYIALASHSQLSYQIMIT